MSELKPCPFCGLTDMYQCQDGSCHMITCRCGAVVEADSPVDATSIWNTRTDHRKLERCRHYRRCPGSVRMTNDFEYECCPCTAWEKEGK